MRSQGEPESLDLLARGTGYSGPCGKTKPFGSSLSADVGKNSEPFGVSGKRKLSTYADSKGLKIPNRSDFCRRRHLANSKRFGVFISESARNAPTLALLPKVKTDNVVRFTQQTRGSQNGQRWPF